MVAEEPGVMEELVMETKEPGVMAVPEVPEPVLLKPATEGPVLLRMGNAVRPCRSRRREQQPHQENRNTQSVFHASALHRPFPAGYRTGRFSGGLSIKRSIIQTFPAGLLFTAPLLTLSLPRSIRCPLIPSYPLSRLRQNQRQSWWSSMSLSGRSLFDQWAHRSASSVLELTVLSQ